MKLETDKEREMAIGKLTEAMEIQKDKVDVLEKATHHLNNLYSDLRTRVLPFQLEQQISDTVNKVLELDGKFRAVVNDLKNKMDLVKLEMMALKGDGVLIEELKEMYIAKRQTLMGMAKHFGVSESYMSKFFSGSMGDEGFKRKVKIYLEAL